MSKKLIQVLLLSIFFISACQSRYGYRSKVNLGNASKENHNSKKYTKGTSLSNIEQPKLAKGKDSTKTDKVFLNTDTNELNEKISVDTVAHYQFFPSSESNYIEKTDIGIKSIKPQKKIPQSKLHHTKGNNSEYTRLAKILCLIMLGLLLIGLLLISEQIAAAIFISISAMLPALIILLAIYGLIEIRKNKNWVRNEPNGIFSLLIAALYLFILVASAIAYTVFSGYPYLLIPLLTLTLLLGPSLTAFYFLNKKIKSD